MCDEQINSAVQILKNGGIIAYPTESVYGLGCDPFNQEAVKKLISLKERNEDKGLILIAAEFEQVAPLLEKLEPDLDERVKKTWPGAITWLWPAKSSTSTLLKGKHNTLAIRITDHPVAKKLCELFGGAIVSTSANKSGEDAAKTVDEVSSSFKNQIDYIINGETSGLNSPTEIRDVISGRVIRPAS